MISVNKDHVQRYITLDAAFPGQDKIYQKTQVSRISLAQSILKHTHASYSYVIKMCETAYYGSIKHEFLIHSKSNPVCTFYVAKRGNLGIKA